MKFKWLERFIPIKKRGDLKKLKPMCVDFNGDIIKQAIVMKYTYCDKTDNYIIRNYIIRKSADGWYTVWLLMQDHKGAWCYLWLECDGFWQNGHWSRPGCWKTFEEAWKALNDRVRNHDMRYKDYKGKVEICRPPIGYQNFPDRTAGLTGYNYEI